MFSTALGITAPTARALSSSTPRRRFLQDRDPKSMRIAENTVHRQSAEVRKWSCDVPRGQTEIRLSRHRRCVRIPLSARTQDIVFAPRVVQVDGCVLIVFEGCVGVGKTTLARGLAKQRGSVLLLEDFESNPFLKPFYADPTRYALEAELFFVFPFSLKCAACQRGRRLHLWVNLIYAIRTCRTRRYCVYFGSFTGFFRTGCQGRR